MDKIWILPICLFIIGYFGIFWTLSLSNIEVDIDLSMDNNTRIAMESIEWEEINGDDDCIDESYWFNGGYGITLEEINESILNDTINCYSLPQKRKGK